MSQMGRIQIDRSFLRLTQDTPTVPLNSPIRTGGRNRPNWSFSEPFLIHRQTWFSASHWNMEMDYWNQWMSIFRFQVCNSLPACTSGSENDLLSILIGNYLVSDILQDMSGIWSSFYPIFCHSVRFVTCIRPEKGCIWPYLPIFDHIEKCIRH